MRVLMLCLLPLPAAAWEFTASPICTLTHDGPSGEIVITYDAAVPEYTLTITTSEAWNRGSRFEIRFHGDRGFAITTDRQSYSADGLSLTVTDTGFGNVLDGLQNSLLLSASDGGPGQHFATVNAAEPVAAFRACPAAATS